MIKSDTQIAVFTVRSSRDVWRHCRRGKDSACSKCGAIEVGSEIRPSAPPLASAPGLGTLPQHFEGIVRRHNDWAIRGRVTKDQYEYH